MQINKIYNVVYRRRLPKSSIVSLSPMFCRYVLSGRNDVDTIPLQPKEVHKDKGLVSLHDAPLFGGAHYLKNKREGFRGGYQPGYDLYDEQPPRFLGGGQAFFQQQVYVQEHSHLTVNGDALDYESLYNPSLVQYSCLPSNKSFCNQHYFVNEAQENIRKSNKPVDILKQDYDIPGNFLNLSLYKDNANGLPTHKKCGKSNANHNTCP